MDEAFESNWIAPLGPNVTAFEKEMAAYVGTSETLALCSGTSALHLALKLCGVGQGDIVLCQSLTFSASANPIKYENAIPVFIDSEPDSWNMSPRALQNAFDKYPNAKAVVAVDLFGTPAKLDELRAICDEHDVPFIEDAAEALGAKYKGKNCGTFGTYGVYSFNGNKIITTSGGGMLVVSGIMRQKALFWATQARDPAPHYQHSELGYNYRLSNVCAGIGRGQLYAINSYIAKKRRIYDIYKSEFSDMPQIKMSPAPEFSEPIRWLSAANFEGIDPLDVYRALMSDNIESRPVWKPMHLQPFYADCDYITNGETLSDGIFAHGLCLPSDVKNTDWDMDRIISVIRKAVKG